MSYKIQLNQFRKYLEIHNWTFENFDNYFDKAIKTVDDELIEFAMPIRDNLNDYDIIIENAIDILSTIEGAKEKKQIKEAIHNMGFDVLKLRFLSSVTEEGTFPLSDFKDVVPYIDDMIKIEACQTMLKKNKYKGRIYDDATYLAEKSEITAFEEGSFIVSIRIPSQNESDQENREFGRNTITNLFMGIKEAKELIVTDDTFEYDKKLNKNVFDAIINLSQTTEDRFDIEMHLQWDETLPQSQTTESIVKINNEDIDKFKLISSKLETLPEPEDVTIKGRVIIMKNDKLNSRDEKGQIVISARDIQKNVYLELEDQEYYQAVESHRDNQDVEITGTLERKTRHWHLGNTSNFRVIPR